MSNHTTEANEIFTDSLKCCTLDFIFILFGFPSAYTINRPICYWYVYYPMKQIQYNQFQL
jgi:hypothetical protein